MTTNTLTHRQASHPRPDPPIPPSSKEKHSTHHPVVTTEKLVGQVVGKVEVAVEKIVERKVSRLSQVLLTLSLVSSFLYWTALIHPFSGYLHMCIKWVSILTLTVIVFRFLTCKQDLFLFAALLCHSLGDLVLAHPYKDWVLYSLGPFLLGHVFYIMTFKADLPEYDKLKANLSKARKALISASVIYCCLMGAILLPGLLHTVFALPIAVYMLVISSMVVLSVLPQYKSPLITLGCWMYVVSDSLIAIDRFYSPLPYPLHALSWPLYYVGQIMISLCLLREKGRNTDNFFISHRLVSF